MFAKRKEPSPPRMPETPVFPEGLRDRISIDISPRRRRFALRVDSARGEIRLCLPPRYNLRRVQNFVDSHLGWIETQISRLPRPVAFEHGMSLPLLGRSCTLNVLRTGGRVTHIEFENDVLHIRTPRDDFTGRLKRFLNDRLREMLTAKAKEKTGTAGLKFSALQVRETRSRWGSCSSQGTLSFSRRLVYAPDYVIDYVVAHETAHLQHHNHSKDFWALCRNLSDDYERGKGWIRRHGDSLYRYP